MNLTLIVGAVLVALNIATGVYAWDADRALRREHDRAEAAVLQRDQLQKHVVTLETAIAERNRRLASFGALPEVRKRLCAQRPPTDGCCKPAPAECKP